MSQFHGAVSQTVWLAFIDAYYATKLITLPAGIYGPSRLSAEVALSELFSATAEDGAGAFVFFTSGSTGRPKAMLRSLDDTGK